MSTVLITGANRGIGLEMAKQFSQQGWKVLTSCRAPENAHALAKLAQASKQISLFKLDVTNPQDISALADQLRNQPIDVLINNAGTFGPRDTKIDTDAWLSVMKTNAIGPLLLTQALIPSIQCSQLKTIVNISSSMGSIEGNTEGSEYIYRSSKAALNAVTKSLSIDLKPLNITVIAIHPGWVKTDMGGANALIDPETSVNGIRQIISQLTLTDTGSFFKYNGTRLPW